MARSAKRATFSLRADILAALDDAVAHGAAPSKNALVERALERELRGLRREARRGEWEEASRDPLFLKDIAELNDDCASVDAESPQEVR
jgi:hypothetical protein